MPKVVSCHASEVSPGPYQLPGDITRILILLPRKEQSEVIPDILYKYGPVAECQRQILATVL